MDSLVLDEPATVRARPNGAGGRRKTRTDNERPDVDVEIVVDLGVWLSGIESFLSSRELGIGSSDPLFILKADERAVELVHSVLERCTLLTARYLSRSVTRSDPRHHDSLDLSGLYTSLQDCILLVGACRNSPLNTRDTVRMAVLDKLRADAAFHAVVSKAEMEGERFLPASLLRAATNSGHVIPGLDDIAALLPDFGKVLRWLNVVERMLRADEPLKPTLVIFARVNEQVLELTERIDRRLKKLPGDDGQIFATLDAAAYTATIELKKVFSQELVALPTLRACTVIYARIETAYSLLNDGFQQMLTTLAREFDPQIEIYELFPEFRQKRENSFALRKGLTGLLETVRSAERSSEQDAISTMQADLHGFMGSTVRFLFYKDIETFERFADEVVAARQSSDLVPILHRFGAYLETLLGQVALRLVLQDELD